MRFSNFFFSERDFSAISEISVENFRGGISTRAVGSLRLLPIVIDIYIKYVFRATIFVRVLLGAAPHEHFVPFCFRLRVVAGAQHSWT